MTQFQVKRKSLAETRIVDGAGMPALADGEVRVKIERFSFTANNTTYAVAGDTLGYWQFFPATDNTADTWGIIPVWGFAEVVESQCSDVPVGDRLYGYFPTAGTVTLKPVAVSPGQFIDGTEHRTKMNVIYNAYRRVEAEPGYDRRYDNVRALLFPLHVTGFCLWDSLQDADWHGAEQILIISASSKTSIGLAFALKDDPRAPKTIGLTSPRNKAFVEGLELYGTAMTYDAVEAIDATLPTVIVDMAGNGPLLGALHKRLGAQMKKSISVGLTHWEQGPTHADIIAERSTFFFAPDHIDKRMADWGPQGFFDKSGAFLQRSFQDSQRWMAINELAGLSSLETVYEGVLNGKRPAEEGIVITL